MIPERKQVAHTPTRFGIHAGFIVTINDDGTVPIGAKIVARYEPGSEALVDQVNLVPELVAALKAIVTDGMRGSPGTRQRQCGEIARAALAKVNS